METVAKILSIEPPNRSLGMDQPIWKPGKEGIFTIKSAYTSIKNATTIALAQFGTLSGKTKFNIDLNSFYGGAAMKAFLQKVELQPGVMSSLVFGSFSEPPLVHSTTNLKNSPANLQTSIPTPTLYPNQNHNDPLVISFSKDEVHQLCSPWLSSIIVRLVGVFIEAPTLAHKLNLIWRLNCDPNIQNIGSGFFIISFNCIEDRWKALLHGPTIIFGHVLSIKLWTPGFKPDADQANIFTPAWVKLEHLLIEFFNATTLIKIGNSIGTFLGTDAPTHNLISRRSARICVLLEISKATPSEVIINGSRQTILVEGISKICFVCGGSNHPSSNCLGKRTQLQIAQTSKTAATSPIENGSEKDWIVVRRKKPKTPPKLHIADGNGKTPSEAHMHETIQISNSNLGQSYPESNNSRGPTTPVSSQGQSKRGQKINKGKKVIASPVRDPIPENYLCYTQGPTSSVPNSMPPSPSDLEPPNIEITPDLVLDICSIKESLARAATSSKHGTENFPSMEMASPPTTRPTPLKEPNHSFSSHSHHLLTSTASNLSNNAFPQPSECPSSHHPKESNPPPTPTSEASNLKKGEHFLNLHNNPATRVQYHWKIWENFTTALITQASWLQAWARLMIKSQHNAFRNNTIKEVMKDMKDNGLALVFPPPSIQSMAFNRESEIDQALLNSNQLLTITTVHSYPMENVIKGNLPEGALVFSTSSVRMIDVCVTSSLKLESGALKYKYLYTPHLSMRPDGNPLLIAADGSSNSLDSVGQNFFVADSNMTPITILIWNARGAASPEFRRVINDLRVCHRPHVLFISETRVGGSRAEQIINTLGFDGQYKVDPMGYAGGLWLLWDPAVVRTTIHGRAFQEIHATIEVFNSDPFFASFIYASPNRDRRKILWSNLMNLSEVVSIPWMICGDFNDILSPDEKWGGNAASASRIRDFKTCIDYCGLSDLGFMGHKFTWYNKRPDGHTVFERLDRFLSNTQWLHIFPEAVVHHLPRIKSDHNPLLLCTNPAYQYRPSRPFKCEQIWLSQLDFINLVHSAWATCPSLPEGLKVIQEKAQHWNKYTFGNIFQRKRKLINRLNGITKALFIRHNPGLVSLEKSLSIEYQKVLLLEEELWASKSRIDWLLLGDSNTSFFHSSVIQRRRSNRINAIKDPSGN
ncbi:reverse transcriptase [Senna tora]|uniref:Reverse transcriptase n=1 Tax=Senna tora TaxID=362788 RepID=A0A834T3Q1_9FABA|nr:reverse transcriptase [Senna tora]